MQEEWYDFPVLFNGLKGSGKMAKSSNQKMKILALREILLERTDEEHLITTAQLIAELERWGVQAERKSIYDDMDTLCDYGLDVQSRKGRDGGWFVGSRDFELPELKLLVDAVQSSKFITRRKSDTLIRKLEALASTHQAKQLQRQVFVSGRVKNMNESIYYTVDRLHAAIGRKKVITFKYFDYNSRKEKVPRRDGAEYTVSPCGLVWDSENYYLVGWDHDRDQVRHYRVDKMSEISVTGRGLEEEALNVDMAGYAQKHFGMFSGKDAAVTMRCREEMAGVVLDRFGQETMLIPGNDGWFSLTVSLVVSPQFFGWLFGLGDAVELVAPQWVVEDYQKRLDEVKKLYRD